MDERFLVVIADSAFETADREQAILGRIDAKVRKFSCSSESEVIEAARDSHVVIVDTSPVTRKVISNLRKAIGIVAYGIGYDNIDVNAATDKGILVCNNPDFMTSEVADHAVALILTLARKLHKIIPSTRTGGWSWREFRPISGLDGKTAGIIGFGNIGRQVAKRLGAFEMQVLAYDPLVPPGIVEGLGAKSVSLQALLRASDIVSIHVPLTKETHHMIGKKEFDLMKDSVILVNTARGSVMDQEALIESLRKKRIAAVGLDVLEGEPPDPTNPILRFENAIVTPHIGWYSEESSRRLQEYAALEAGRILTGQPTKHPINLQALRTR